MNLEGSNSAETSPPSGGGIGLHLLSIWIVGCSLGDRLFFGGGVLKNCYLVLLSTVFSHSGFFFLMSVLIHESLKKCRNLSTYLQVHRSCFSPYPCTRFLLKDVSLAFVLILCIIYWRVSHSAHACSQVSAGTHLQNILLIILFQLSSRYPFELFQVGPTSSQVKH